MSAIVYSAKSDDCSITIPIVVVVEKKYAIIGPEYKKGISNCITFSDFQPPILEHTPKNYNCSQRCLDLYEALKDNFQYYGDLDETHLLGCLAMYAWIAKKCNIKHLIPDVLLGLIEFVIDFGDIPIFVAKHIQDTATDSRKIREWYFVQLGMQVESKELIIDPEAGKIIVTSYIPDIIKYTMIKNEEEFNKLVVTLAETIENNTKFLNFLHGNVHIGHVTTSGKLIDFGDSFNIYEKAAMKKYLELNLSPRKKIDKAIKKYEVQNVDVGAVCTLIELRNFFQSILDSTQKNPDLVRFKKFSLEVIGWVASILDEYFGDFELSIFTMIKKNNEFGRAFGGFDTPPDPSELPGDFPTQFFLKEFGLSGQK